MEDSENWHLQIRPYLPPIPRLSGSWSLLYSLDQHGISLNTLYTRCSTHLGGSLVVIKDSEDVLFGTWLGESIHQSKGAYYGSGESYGLKHAPTRNTHNKFYFTAFSGKSKIPSMCTNGRGRTTMWPSASLSICLSAEGKGFCANGFGTPCSSINLVMENMDYIWTTHCLMVPPPGVPLSLTSRCVQI